MNPFEPPIGDEPTPTPKPRLPPLLPKGWLARLGRRVLALVIATFGLWILLDVVFFTLPDERAPKLLAVVLCVVAASWILPEKD